MPKNDIETIVEGIQYDQAVQACISILQARPEGGEVVIHNYEIMTGPADHSSCDDTCPCLPKILRVEPKPVQVN